MREERVLELLPELQNIKDSELRNQVKNIFCEQAPDYFWHIPASSTGKYHPRDTIDERGLLIHVKRSYKVFERLSSSYIEMGCISEEEADYGRAAILLHDLFKQGIPPRDEKHTSDDHDEIAYNYLKSTTELPDSVLRCILTHNGGWGEGKEPETNLEHLHHLADMVSSGRNVYVEMENPVPEELEEKTVFGTDTEELAGFAHKLWMHWSKNIAEEEDISEGRLERWQQLWTEYEDLTEEQKDKDREMVERFWK